MLCERKCFKEEHQRRVHELSSNFCEEFSFLISCFCWCSAKKGSEWIDNLGRKMMSKGEFMNFKRKLFWFGEIKFSVELLQSHWCIADDLNVKNVRRSFPLLWLLCLSEVVSELRMLNLRNKSASTKIDLGHESLMQKCFKVNAEMNVLDSKLGILCTNEGFRFVFSLEQIVNLIHLE